MCLALVIPACGDTPSTHEKQAGESSDSLTAPGTTLPLGDPATLPRTGSVGIIVLTVEDIETGDVDDLRELGFDTAPGTTAYYVALSMRHVSGTYPGFTPNEYLSAWAGELPLDHLTVRRPFPPCEPGGFPTEAIAGHEYAACMVWLAKPGLPAPDSVVFDNDDSYETLDGTHVEWTWDASAVPSPS